MIGYRLQGAFTYIISFDSYTKQKKNNQWERKNDFFFKLIMSISGQWAINTWTYQKHDSDPHKPQYLFFCVGWQFDINWIFGISEGGNPNRHEVLNINRHDTQRVVRDKKKDARKDHLIVRLMSNHAIPSKCHKTNLITCES